ncbi:RelA/SpoT domain-containing protein [Pantoea agglomerans]|uniref:RelA/SpoT domain-containing protein n=1 Tax=Enterobacter agglomerans TaxID=549 RepID=UPI001654BE87|nr:RelA/SpoT domain-containing protein [Pantoea agglomerans]
MSKVISEFINRYEKEYDFYHNLSHNVEDKIKQSLSRAGVRAIVSSRAKSISRLDVKLEDRNRKKHYKAVSDIYDDIVDLSGVRVALYFPGDMDVVEDIINKNFHVHKVKRFPESLEKKKIGEYTKVFDGYSAAHFRVSLNDESRYGKNHCVEIQVASVLMHAWSEVEHDLVYKPLQGELSNEELMILDEINGLVLSGNIALERLQRAGIQRVSNESNTEFLNHYDFASFTLSKIKVNEDLFDFKTIFHLLKVADINNRDDIGRVIDKFKEFDKVKVIRNKKFHIRPEMLFVKAMAFLHPEKSIAVALEFNYDGSDYAKLLVHLLTNAIIAKDLTGCVDKLIKSIPFLAFEYELFDREQFLNEYSGIIDLKEMEDKELEKLFTKLDSLNDKIGQLDITKAEINEFINLCTLISVQPQPTPV